MKIVKFNRSFEEKTKITFEEMIRTIYFDH